MEYKNIMQVPRIEKVVVNIGCGESGEKLRRAEKLLQKLINKKPVRTISRHKIPSWGIKKREPIGCKVTLRGKDAEEFLKRAFIAKDNQIKKSNFDEYGNFSFGIHEYIDFPGIKYDPDIGIFGMDICVSLERPGFRIKRRRIKKSKIPSRNRISKEEAIEFIKNKFKVKII
ncbi:MAG: 50S ribosomal protein L5 [Candidatus Altiarchaeales archaeon]|nr:MAG: 50S ribosomal protein L5 [Candidatus Altiarchaeales archaeon]RLI95487.1 MAG: 50S ribosomal protein L5 [Candidatus Altiarchaeales archaeon]HDO81933.1 50S ribosomal protein L5 [Candidatus Altiarchaeales archaeon]HEX54582.1 50S ribosomal protein L5 [Candidatus Altiarchaeales archaeon]